MNKKNFILSLLLFALQISIPILHTNVVYAQEAGEVECNTCLLDVSEDEYHTLSCNHGMCNNCFRLYLNTAFNDAINIDLLCPDSSCKRPISDVDMQAMKSFARDIIIRFERRVEQDRQDRLNTVQSKFSFSSMMSDARLYFTTKPCPACGVRIEKNGGCDHMTCVNKQGHLSEEQRQRGIKGEDYHFCWHCLQPSTFARHGCAPKNIKMVAPVVAGIGCITGGLIYKKIKRHQGQKSNSSDMDDNLKLSLSQNLKNALLDIREGFIFENHTKGSRVIQVISALGVFAILTKTGVNLYEPINLYCWRRWDESYFNFLNRIRWSSTSAEGLINLIESGCLFNIGLAIGSSFLIKPVVRKLTGNAISKDASVKPVQESFFDKLKRVQQRMKSHLVSRSQRIYSATKNTLKKIGSKFYQAGMGINNITRGTRDAITKIGFNIHEGLVGEKNTVESISAQVAFSLGVFAILSRKDTHFMRFLESRMSEDAYLNLCTDLYGKSDIIDMFLYKSDIVINAGAAVGSGLAIKPVYKQLNYAYNRLKTKKISN